MQDPLTLTSCAQSVEATQQHSRGSSSSCLFADPLHAAFSRQVRPPLIVAYWLQRSSSGSGPMCRMLPDPVRPKDLHHLLAHDCGARGHGAQHAGPGDHGSHARQLQFHFIHHKPQHHCHLRLTAARDSMTRSMHAAATMAAVNTASVPKGKSSGSWSNVRDGCTRLRNRSSPRASMMHVDSMAAGAHVTPASMREEI